MILLLLLLDSVLFVICSFFSFFHLSFFKGPDGCTDGDVRLWGGQSEREGEVQVCKDGVWGYICSDTWNDVNAKTVCKQLQFSDTCKL